MSVSLLGSAAVMAVAIPSPVIWADSVFGAIFVLGVGVIFFAGDWQRARGLDKLILLGAVFYAAPIAAFASEHFTLTKVIASLVPAWIPWHTFWAYLVGSCFFAAGLSLVTRIQTRLAARLLALTFFLFVALMDAPLWVRHPGNQFALTFTLRELSFGAGALALAASLSGEGREGGTGVVARGVVATHMSATIARYCIAVSVLFYSFEQFVRGDHVPGVPLERITPQWIWGHAIWTYVAAVVYAVAGISLLVGKKTRAAAAWLGLTVLLLVLIVYVPIEVVERADLDAFNYLADTLMYGGAVLMLAGAMARESG